jgi:hypothetical protein
VIARVAIIAAALTVSAPEARPFDLVTFAVAAAQIERVAPVDGLDLAALAWIETGGSYRRDRVSRAGACGVLQVLPRWSTWTCEQMKGPLIGVVAGATSWAYWVGRSRSLEQAATMYNGGNRPGARAILYGRMWAHERRILRGAR